MKKPLLLSLAKKAVNTENEPIKRNGLILLFHYTAESQSLSKSDLSTSEKMTWNIPTASIQNRVIV